MDFIPDTPEYSARGFRTAAPHLLALRLTPLLRSKIQSAFELHQQDQDDRSEVAQQRLQRSRDDVNKHWKRHFESPLVLGAMMSMLELFAKAIGGLTLCDYTSERLSVTDLDLAVYVWSYGNDQQRAQAVTQALRDQFAFSAAEFADQLDLNMEMMQQQLLLDRAHVERRFKASCEGKNLVQSFIKEGKRSELADLLAKDEQTLRNLTMLFSPCQVVLNAVLIEKDRQLGTQSMQEKDSTTSLLGQQQNVAFMFRAAYPRGGLLHTLRNFFSFS